MSKIFEHVSNQVAILMIQRCINDGNIDSQHKFLDQNRSFHNNSPNPKTLINQILTNPQTIKIQDLKRSEKQSHGEVDEADDGPGGAGGAPGDGEDEEPREEEDEDVCGPHAGVHEPLRVFVHIRRRLSLNVQLRHRDSILSA